MIILSWTAQAVNSQQRIEERQPQRAPHLSRHASLNVRGVDPRRALEHDDSEPDSSQQESPVCQR
jgi:hypothetical protein